MSAWMYLPSRSAGAISYLGTMALEYGVQRSHICSLFLRVASELGDNFEVAQLIHIEFRDSNSVLLLPRLLLVHASENVESPT